MIKATHENGYSAELREDGALFIDNPDGNEIMTSESCDATTEEDLLDYLERIPSFLAGVEEYYREKQESN